MQRENHTVTIQTKFYGERKFSQTGAREPFPAGDQTSQWLWMDNTAD